MAMGWVLELGLVLALDLVVVMVVRMAMGLESELG